MTDYLAPDYIATVREDGLLTVRKRTPKTVTKLQSNGEGGLDMTWVTAANATDSSEKRLMEWFDRSPTFLATYGGSRHWHVDIDCGAQRFHGKKTHGVILKALANCGFSEDSIWALVKECRAHPKWNCCPYYHG